MSAEEVDAWFVVQVLPLEAALERFLRRGRLAGDEVIDLRQEVYARVYAAARRCRPLAAKPFVFATARNLLRDRARRARIVSFEAVAHLETLDIAADLVPADQVVSARDELKLLQAAVDALPRRCREVVVLRKVHGLSQREVAARLGIAEATVERQVAKGVRALAVAVYGRLKETEALGRTAANVREDQA